MTFSDTIDLIFSTALWLHCVERDADACEEVWRTYAATRVRAAQAGWRAPESLVVFRHVADDAWWTLRGA
jgi:hypothetical protein